MDFLFEIGLEEVPARMIGAAQQELHKRVVALLERERLTPADAASNSFSTPRRLAVLVGGVAASQEDISEDLVGPSTKIAYKDGAPTPAAVAFAKKAGIEVSALKTVTNAKGEYLAATVTKAGRTAAEVIAAELPKELAGIYWAKNMYWRAGKPERFVRPVRWLLALLDDSVIPVEFAGYTASNVTYGHRVLAGPDPIAIHSPARYDVALLEASVMADVEIRRHTIRKALDRVCRTIPDTRWREDHALVEKMTHMTEWPSVIAGSFDPDYLTLPEEVLVTVMRDHQNYFAVEDKSGKLAPHFLAVLNTVATEAGDAVIRHGNERVLRARFNDARFFWEFDQRTPLADRVELLKNVTFQKDLGSYYAKTERVRNLAQTLAAIVQPRGCELNVAALDEAATLAKADLTCELVKEFTELQGIIGGLYARTAGLSETTAAAIYDQYTPTSTSDPIPRTKEGVTLGLAERMDTIAQMFNIGLEPTGSKDPFGLRRAANALVRLLAEGGLPITLSDLLAECNPTRDIAIKLARFFNERIEFYLRDVRGHSYDVVKAVMMPGANGLSDAVARAEAVTEARGSADFIAVCAAFKRMKNILIQSDESGITTTISELPKEVTVHPAQMALNNAVTKASGRFGELCDHRRYVEALALLATIRPQVDAFMDPKTGVKVLDDVPYVRETRLNLLRQLLDNFSRIADFSEIVTAG